MSLEDLLKRVDDAGFTPGPWVVDDNPNCGDGLNIKDGLGRRLAHTSAVRNLDGKPPGTFIEADEAKTNARLIAAAPDMFEALKQVHREMEAGFGSSFGETREQVRRALLRALISQKEGVE